MRGFIHCPMPFQHDFLEWLRLLVHLIHRTDDDEFIFILYSSIISLLSVPSGFPRYRGLKGSIRNGH